MNRRSWPVSAVVLAVGALAIGCASAGGEDSQPAEASMVFDVTPGLLTTGQQTYLTNCAPCHGPGGKGDGPSAATLNPPPRDHTNAEYMNNLPDKKIADTIKMGGIISGYPNMPSNPHLKGDEIVALVAYVRRLSSPDAPRVDLTGFTMPQ